MSRDTNAEAGYISYRYDGEPIDATSYEDYLEKIEPLVDDPEQMDILKALFDKPNTRRDPIE